MMDALFSKLVTRVYELEGLLLVVDKHGDDTPLVVRQRIGELGDDIARQARQLSENLQNDAMAPSPSLGGTEGEPVAPMQPPVFVEPKAEPVVDDLPDKDYDADETWQHDNGEEPAEVFRVDYQEPKVEPVMPPPMPQPEPEPADDGSLRVDEKLQRTLSKDMHKALSINDRFRFKRELFSNSDVELNQALDLVNAMQSFDEAQEYFIDDLGWDPDNEDVADFMGLIRRHFL